MSFETRANGAARIVKKIALVSVSYIAFTAATSSEIRAQSTQTQPAPSATSPSNLPAVQVNEPERKTRKKGNRSNAENAAARRRNEQRDAERQPAKPADTYDNRTGTVGYFTNSTSVATKTNTPLVNIPQSITVLPQQFLQDQNTHSITDITRYVPGVAVHQGEGNRDELVIRGVDSSANFFVNGFRDDVQYFRDLYNAQSVEVLKGPSALTFGRGAGGGLVNRTLKEADGQHIYQVTAQGGSWNDRRFTVDAGDKITDTVAFRLNAMFEEGDTFRDWGHQKRYGFNPTVTLQPTEDTKIKLSYELYYDRELADRGNPSVDSPPTAKSDPSKPFVPHGDFSTFFGSPIYNNTYAQVNQAFAILEHDFNNGWTFKNSSMWANYDRGYRNIFPGTSAVGNPTPPLHAPANQFYLTGYQNQTNRENLFNQSDFTYKGYTGPIFHTFAFGSEFGRQAGFSRRDSAVFQNTGTTFEPVDPFNPTYFGGVDFVHHFTANPASPDGVLTADNFGTYVLHTASAYAQDQIDLTRWLQLFLGARFDHFALDATNLNDNSFRSRTDDKVSPRAALILKPADNMSFYGSYSISYLPASGDQFSTLTDGTMILQPQKFENTEVGFKWNINPRLLYTAAIYQLDRTGVPISDPNNSGFFFPNGVHHIKGFENSLTGYVTKDWQTTLGYAYTDAKIGNDISGSIKAGNRVQLVPYNQVSLWNKYQFNPIWAGGLGVIYFSDSYAASDDLVRLPGFVRVDAALYAKISQNWRVQLNVENIFDKGYWASADGNNNLSPGQGRTVKLQTIATF